MKTSSQIAQRRIIYILIGIFLVFLFAIGFIAYPKAKQQWAAPLGPGLELPTYTPTHHPPTDTNTAPTSTKENPLTTPISRSNKQETRTIETTPTLRATTTSEPICGGPPLMYILGIGVDTRDNSFTYGLADVMRVARVDFTTPKVTVLSIPRDLWVEIPDIEDHGITHGKINQSFLYGGPGMGYYDGPGGAPGLVARTINHNFNLRVDHYGVLNMLTFEKIIDAVGGIDLYLPTDVDGTPINSSTRDMGYFYGGQNHFTGDEALRFSRIRKRYSDYVRVDNQNLVLCALRDKLLSPKVLPKIPQIIASFYGSVLTDLSLEQLSQIACLLPYVERENLIFTGLPQDILVHDRIYSPQMRAETYATQADMEVLRDYFQQFMEGTWPSQPDEPTCP